MKKRIVEYKDDIVKDKYKPILNILKNEGLEEIKKRINKNKEKVDKGYVAYCHNDMAGNLIIKNNNIFFVDWENSSINDVICQVPRPEGRGLSVSSTSNPHG